MAQDPLRAPETALMLPVDSKRVEVLFAGALELPAGAERAAYLAEACGSNLPLRHRVQALLAAYHSAKHFLQEPFAVPVAEIATPNFRSEQTSPDLPSFSDTPVLGDYQLLEKLAQGNMGVVYRARQRSLNRLVAVKLILTGQLASPEEVQRFRSEAEAAATLDHPNIVPIYEVGEENGRHFFSMKLIEGSSLSQEVHRLRRQPREAAGLLALVARAVHHAHQRGILHRDLKPSNILLSVSRDAQRSASDQCASGPRAPLRVAANPEWVPHVADFGLAKRVEGDSSLTRTGIIVGTPSYMAPEQIQGGGRVGPAADIHALGAILYELLTGRPPFKGRGVLETLELVRRQEPVPPRLLQPGTPRDLETICLRCLNKEPARRYATAEALAEDLQRFLAGEPIRARPVGELERGWLWIKRNPRVVGLLAAVLVSLVLGTVVSSVLAARAAVHARRADRNADQAAQEAAAARDARHQLGLTLADSYTELGLAAAERKEPAVAALWFARALQQSEGDPDREAHNRIRLAGVTREVFTPQRAFRVPGWWIARTAFHPGGRYLLLRRFPLQDCAVWDLDREAPWAPPEGFEALTAAAWSPAGDRIALGAADGRAGVFHFPSGVPIQTWHDPGPALAAGFSSDGTRAAAGGTLVRVWDLQAQRFLTPDPGLAHGKPAWSAGFSPDGRLLVTAARDAFARCYDLASTEAEPRWHVRHWPGYFAPRPWPLPPLFLDGGRLVLTIPTPDVLAWLDPATGQLQHQGKTLDGIVDLAVTGDGQHLWTGGPAYFGLWSLDGKYRPLDPALPGGITSLAPIPRAPLAAVGGRDRQTHFLQESNGAPGPPPLRHSALPFGTSWSADGSRLAAGQQDGLVRVLTQPPGPPVRTLPLGVPFCRVRFGPGGRFVLPTGGAWNWVSTSKVQLYDPASGTPLPQVFDLGGQLLDADLSPDNRLLVTCSRDRKKLNSAGMIRFWEVSTGRPLGEALRTPPGVEPRSVRFRPDGEQAAVVYNTGQALTIAVASRQVRMCSNPRFTLRYLTPVNNGMVRYSRDGQRLYVYGRVAGDHGLTVLDPDSGQIRYQVRCSHCDDVQESPDGRVLAITAHPTPGSPTGGPVQLLDPQTGAELAPPLLHPDWVASVRFSADGTRMLTACLDHTARLWDWQAGKVLAVFPTGNRLYAAEFTPDARLVVTASWDETARVWDVRTGQPLSQPLRLNGQGLTLDVTPDGRFAVIGGKMPGLKLLDLRELTRPAEGTPTQLQRWTEVLAFQRIEGGRLTPLTTDEWLQRWKEHRQSLATAERKEERSWLK